MKLDRFLPGLAMGAVLGTAVSAFALPKTYQWTGKVTEVSAKEIHVQKGTETWEFAIDEDTNKSSGGKVDAKKDDKVTVTYRMYATKIEK